MEKKLFFAALLFSLCLHAALIGSLSLSNYKLSNVKETFKSLEVTYKDMKPAKKEKSEIVFSDLGLSKIPKSDEPQKVKVLTKKENMFSVIGDSIRDISKLSGKLLSGQKKSPKITILDVKRKITLPPMTATKITNPKYLTYNDGMRNVISSNIKQRAYSYINHKDFEAGEVYLTFVLSSNGNLNHLQIIENKTKANEYLRGVAKKSIRESSPFPAFPDGFDYPEFTFNLLISFQE